MQVTNSNEFVMIIIII